MVTSIETNLDQEIREFNQVNDKVDNHIQQIQKDFDMNATLVKYTKNKLENHMCLVLKIKYIPISKKYQQAI